MFKSILKKLSFLNNDCKIISYKFYERCWGNNFNLIRKYDDDGNKWRIAIWSNTNPVLGDILLLGVEPERNVGYKIYEIEPCYNPPDMYFVKAEFVKKETYEHMLNPR